MHGHMDLLRFLYKIFGNLTAMNLVSLTHMKDSPWYKKWMENGEKIMVGAKSFIDKIETKEWFGNTFL